MILFLLFLFYFSDNCEEAKRLYIKAMKEDTSIDDKIKFLEESIKICDDFIVRVELGKAFFKKNNYEKSYIYFSKAYELSNNKDKKDIAYLLLYLGIASENLKKIDEAQIYYKKSIQTLRTAEAEEALKRLEKENLDKILPAQEIVKKLKTKAIIVSAPSIDIRIHFDFDSYIINTEGKKQALALGEALLDESFKNYKFRIIGHTDTIGSAEYNEKLSYKRAETVKNFLIDNFPALKDNITEIEGKGEAEPLYSSTDEISNALNRRVEVIIDSY